MAHFSAQELIAKHMIWEQYLPAAVGIAILKYGLYDLDISSIAPSSTALSPPGSRWCTSGA